MNRVCTRCNKEFKYPCRLEQHKTVNKCKESVKTVICLDKCLDVDKGEIIDKKYSCSKCNLFYTKYKQSLNRHIKQCKVFEIIEAKIDEIEEDNLKLDEINDDSDNETVEEDLLALNKVYNRLEKKMIAIIDNKFMELKDFIRSTQQLNLQQNPQQIKTIASHNSITNSLAIINGNGNNSNNNNTINANINIAPDFIYPFGCENVDLLNESDLEIICKDPRKFFINVLIMLYSKKEHFNFTKDNLNETDLKYFDVDTLKLIYVDEKMFKDKLKDRLLKLCIIIIYKCKNKLSRKKLIQFVNKIIILDESLNPSMNKNKANEAEINTAISSTLNTNLRNRMILTKLNVFYDRYNTNEEFRNTVNSKLIDIKEFNATAILDFYKNPDEEARGLSYEEVNTIIESYPKDETNLFKLRRIIRYNNDKKEDLEDAAHRKAHLDLIGKSLHFPKK